MFMTAFRTLFFLKMIALEALSGRFLRDRKEFPVKLAATIPGYYNTASVIIDDHYAHIRNYPLDIGFYSTVKNNREFHHITHDFVINIQEYRNSKMRGLIFGEKQTIRIELQDPEVYDYHCDYVELKYILRGTLDLSINGKIETFRENQLMLINPHTYHHECLDGSDCVVVNVNISASVFKRVLMEHLAQSPLQKYLTASLMKRSEEESYIAFIPTNDSSREIIEDYINRILSEAQNPQPGQQFFYEGYVLRLMNHLSDEYRVIKGKKQQQEYNQFLLESIVTYMRDHLTDLKIEDMEREFHYHANFFNRFLRSNFGVTFSEYLIQLRMDRAKELLKDTRMNIDEIIYLVGYSNKGFFYKKFLETTGMTPAKFRKSSKPPVQAEG